MKILQLCLACLILTSSQSFAQYYDDEPAEEQIVAFQASIIPPLSTNGSRSYRYTNRLSLNLFAGLAGGLRGTEISGIASIELHDVHGFQYAGITNVVGENVRGAQFAGILNAVGKEVRGAQFGGIANAAGGRVTGAQFAGIVNVAGGALEGAQFGGIANVARSVDGVQVAGIVNVSGGNVKGAQIGLVNLAKHVDGVQIGLLNFAPDGYRRLEVWASDVLHGNVAYKMGGNRKFYNIFALGGSLPSAKEARWGYGYGLGTNFHMGKKSQISIEGIAYQVNEAGTYWDELNLLNQLRVSFIFPLKNRFAFTITPTFNVQVSQLQDAEGNIGTKWVNWNVYDEAVGDYTRVRMWPGVNVGFQF